MNSRGIVHALEIIPILVIWLLLFHGVLEAAAHVHAETNEQAIRARLWERARDVSDALVHTHSIHAWEGCATFSEEKKRVREYEVSRACIQKLSSDAPTMIHRVRLRTMNETLDAFERADQNGTRCESVQTPVLLEGENEMGVLEVIACE